MLFMLAFALDLATPQDPPKNGDHIGDWIVERDQDSMTDKVITSVHVRSDNARFDYGCNLATGGKTQFIVTTTEFLGGVRGDNFRDVMFRVDGDKPLKLRWRYSGSTASASYSDVMVPVINALTWGKSLTIRLFRYDGVPVEARFEVAEAAKALAFVDQQCR